MIGFRNGVLDTLTGVFSPQQITLAALRCATWTPSGGGRNAETTRQTSGAGSTIGTSGNADKRDVILAALFMVLANRYDWQLFLDVTGTGGSGKSILAEIATLLAGKTTPRLRPSRRWSHHANARR